VSAGKKIEFGVASHVTLKDAPINSDWILEGEPVARNALLSRSEDQSAFTLIWECTAGVFDWHYDIDETVYILEGMVEVTDDTGATRRLDAGGTAFFPAGSHARWRVQNYVRKVAFCRNPLPKSYLLAKNMAKTVLRTVGLRKADGGSTMFGVAS
jgi:uncharacterized protein